MNQSTENKLTFSQGQIIWTYLFLSVLLLLILLNNGLILATMFSQRRLQSQIIFVALGSLSLAQLVGGLLLIPAYITLLEDYQSKTRIKFARVVTVFCGVASQLHLTTLCIDRCIALMDSIAYGNLKRGTVVITVLITWLLTIVVSVLSILDFKNFSVFLVTAFYIVPWLIDMFGYCVAYRTVSSMGTGNQTTLLRKEFRLAKSFAIMTLVFALLWLPYAITILLRDHCTSCHLTSSLLLFVLYFQSLSLTFSSLVYYRGSLDFRLAFKIVVQELGNFLREKRDRQDDTIQGTPSSTQNCRTGTPSNRDEDVSHINVAMFLETEEEKIMRMKQSTAHQSLSQGEVNKGTSLVETEEVHIVPYDQAQFFDQTAPSEEPQEESRASEASRFEMLNRQEGSKKELQSSIASHDIEIVPYEQSY